MHVGTKIDVGGYRARGRRVSLQPGRSRACQGVYPAEVVDHVSLKEMLDKGEEKSRIKG